jgi:hypothetical protein
VSDINTRIAEQLVGMLDRHGFDVTVQQRSAQTSDLEVENLPWNALATVSAVWDNPRTQIKGLNDGAPASMVTRRMTIAYLEDLKNTPVSVGLRVQANGVFHNVLGIAEIGAQAGLRLTLDTGTGA